MSCLKISAQFQFLAFAATVFLAAETTAKSLRRQDDVVVVFERPERSPKGPIPKGSGNNVRNSNVRNSGSGSASVSLPYKQFMLSRSRWGRG